MYEDKFDNSDYPETSQFYDKTNRKVIGKFKDEPAGLVIKNSLVCEVKMYYLRQQWKQ